MATVAQSVPPSAGKWRPKQKKGSQYKGSTNGSRKGSPSTLDEPELPEVKARTQAATHGSHMLEEPVSSRPGVVATEPGPPSKAMLAGFPGKFEQGSADFNPSSCLDRLDYGPAPESPAGLYDWLDRHNRHFGLFINNQWVKRPEHKKRASYCPATMELLAYTTEGTEEDVENAVQAARAAFPLWSGLSGHERAKHLYSLARHIQKHMRLLSVCESMDNGKSFRETKNADIPVVARHVYHHAGWAQLAAEEMKGYKPLGVIAEIVPWNFPLMLLAWKVCPALAMGNTVVLKPASYTRLSALLFAEICAEAGLPPGVFNLITGSGRIGSTIADHPGVDKVAFTGSTEVGALLRRRVAGSGKKISLELGGKSPVVVFESADLDSAVEGVVDAIWFNQGQVCSAGSRLLVQESVYDRVIAKLKRRMGTFRLSHPLEKDIDMGALVDKSQYDTIRGYVERAKAEGASVFLAPVTVPSQGWYWPPTLITDVSTVSECVREEIFGPVLTVMVFRNVQEAIALANNTFFGLGASVWTENINLAMEVAISIKAGTVWVNAHNLFDAAAGFGGYRESGFGRDGGKEGLYEYVKPAWQSRPRPSLTFPTRSEDIKWPSIAPAAPAPVEVSTSADFKSPMGSFSIDRTPKVYIGGKQCRPDWQYSRPVLSSEGKLISQVAEGNRKDIRNAVEAAHKAAAGWGKRAAHNRAQICYYIAENLMARSLEFAQRIVAQTSRTMESAAREVELAIERLFYYAAYADKYGGTVQETSFYGLTVAIHEPVGVIGIACPDAFPLLALVSLVAPAVIRGNTVVVIPSPTAPLCATDLYQVLDTSDLPGGVINIVTGDRDFLTRTLSEHDDVMGLWYHGSEQGSRNVEFAAADNMKRTWVNYGVEWAWDDPQQGQGLEYLRHAIEVKNVWVPMGEVQ